MGLGERIKTKSTKVVSIQPRLNSGVEDFDLGANDEWLDELATNLNRLSKAGYKFPQLEKRRGQYDEYILTAGLFKRRVLELATLKSKDSHSQKVIVNIYKTLGNIPIVEEQLGQSIKDQVKFKVLDEGLVRIVIQVIKFLQSERVSPKEKQEVKKVILALIDSSRTMRIKALKDTIIHSLVMNILTFVSIPLASFLVYYLSNSLLSTSAIATFFYLIAPYPTWVRVVLLRVKLSRTKHAMLAIMESWVLMTCPFPLPGINTLGTYPSSLALQQSNIREFENIYKKESKVVSFINRLYLALKLR